MSKRIIALPDIHYPHQIDLTPIETFMKDFKPTHIIYLGDLISVDYIGKFADASDKEGKRLKQDYEYIRDMFNRHRSINKSKLIWILGNHEERINTLTRKLPEVFKGFIELDQYFKDDVDQIIKYGYVWKASKYLGYMHGSYYNIHHSKKTGQEFSDMSIVYGHVHDTQKHTFMNARDYNTPKPRYAQSIGCLSTLSPEFLRRRGRGNKWVHAFSIAYVRENGHFNEFTIHIINNRFQYGGKTYEADKHNQQVQKKIGPGRLLHRSSQK